jgi:hypothetical protein
LKFFNQLLLSWLLLLYHIHLFHSVNIRVSWLGKLLNWLRFRRRFFIDFIRKLKFNVFILLIFTLDTSNRLIKIPREWIDILLFRINCIESEKIIWNNILLHIRYLFFVYLSFVFYHFNFFYRFLNFQLTFLRWFIFTRYSWIIRTWSYYMRLHWLFLDNSEWFWVSNRNCTSYFILMYKISTWNSFSYLLRLMIFDTISSLFLFYSKRFLFYRLWWNFNFLFWWTQNNFWFLYPFRLSYLLFFFFFLFFF